MTVDVVLIWHAHILNPRGFLEDCMRAGLGGFWAAGLPWDVLNPCIDDTTFKYNVSNDGKTRWGDNTGRSWNNIEDPLEKTIKCPVCSTANAVPWTTCGMPESEKADASDDLKGLGYGDGSFFHICVSCSRPITNDLLEVASFVNDFQRLLMYSHPMPGTILNYDTGLPKKLDYSSQVFWGQTLPNRLLKNALRTEIMKLLDASNPEAESSSIETVRRTLENAILSTSTLRLAEPSYPHARTPRIGAEGKVHVRKMMSRYWKNRSPFALDLAGAVHRQGSFVQKMYKVRCCLYPIYTKAHANMS